MDVFIILIIIFIFHCSLDVNVTCLEKKKNECKSFDRYYLVIHSTIGYYIMNYRKKEIVFQL